MSDVHEEFLAEAQEIIESLSRDLLLLDQAQKEHGPELDQTTSELINEVFRGVHTLKGIAGMFGYARLGEVSHALEDLLDQRRGKFGIIKGRYKHVVLYRLGYAGRIGNGSRKILQACWC